jgi:hypothetical protein
MDFKFSSKLKKLTINSESQNPAVITSSHCFYGVYSADFAIILPLSELLASDAWEPSIKIMFCILRRIKCILLLP